MAATTSLWLLPRRLPGQDPHSSGTGGAAARTPPTQEREHPGLHPRSRVVAVDARGEEMLVLGEAVAEVGDHRELDRVVEVPVGPGENADALRPAAAGVAGDAAGLAGRRGGEALADPLREALDEDGDRLVIRGEGLTVDDVGELLRRLRLSVYFNDVRLERTEQVASANDSQALQRFTLIARL